MKHFSFIAVGLALCLCMGSFAVLPGEVSSAFDVTYVDDDAGYVDGDGDEYFSTISKAIENTSAGGTVYVASGTYSLSNVTIDENIRLIGEDPSTTIIDNGGTSRYLYIYDVDASTLIEGFTFVNGSADDSEDSSYHDYGGAICIVNSSPTINNCLFTENTAKYGGAIYAIASFPTISHCTFDTNQATSTGGVLYCKNSELVILASEFVGNEAKYTGALHIGEGSSADIDGCLFKDNVADSEGGESSVAGALRLDENTDSLINNCRFMDNSAEKRGGGIFVSNCQGTIIKNSIFNGNSAPRGGAFYLDDASDVFDSSIEITNCTLYDNSASISGSVINAKTVESEFIVVTMTNCIVWNNSTADIIYSQGDGTFICNVAYSDVQGGRTGAGNIDTDPLFVDPASDLSLQASSPCVDTGTDTSAAGYGSVVSDIEGVLRPQGSGYDMGAYEFYVATDDPWSPVSIMPLMRTQLASVGDAWNELSETLPDEPDEDMTRLIERIQAHMQNATGLANPVYASGELARALELMDELSNMLDS